MIAEILLLVLGFGILIKGADWLVDGGSALARKYRVSDLAIGLTIVAFGTSMPEFVVNTYASFQGHANIVFGNIIGSNNFNLFIILGLSGLIAPLVVQASTVWKEIPISLFAAIMLLFLANGFFVGNPILSRMDGFILVIFFLLFLFYVFKQMRADILPMNLPHKSYSVWKIWVFIFGGLVLLVLGGRLVVINAVNIARDFGISETIIGLTIVAAGTSLPELATSVMAAIRKNNDIAVGNIIGSNIFNIFFITGVSSLIRPLDFNRQFNIDLILLLGGTVLLFLTMFLGGRRKLDRWEAGVLFLIYTGYMVYMILGKLN